jgi:ankyrin repeat protein
MQIAARNGNIPMLELLFQNGGNIHSKGASNDSLYQMATQNGYLKVIKWLDKNGVLDEVDDNGKTAVHVAAKRYEYEILKYLDCEMGCNFRLENLDGSTPLQCIPRNGDEPKKLERCRELVRSIVAEANKRDLEHQKH